MDKEIKDFPIYLKKFDIFPLDSKSTVNRFRLVNNYCDIEINENVKLIIDILIEKNGIKYVEFIDKCTKYFSSDKDEIDKVTELLLNKKIISKQKEEEEEKLNYFRNKFIFFWLRIKLIDTDKYKKLISLWTKKERFPKISKNILCVHSIILP